MVHSKIQTQLPTLCLSQTNDQFVEFSTLKGYTVLCIYPQVTNLSAQSISQWQRSKKNTLLSKVNILGISTQNMVLQKESKSRLELEYELLCDKNMVLAKTLNLPTFKKEGQTFFKQITLICKDNEVVHSMYPIHSANDNAKAVEEWLQNNTNIEGS